MSRAFEVVDNANDSILNVWMPLYDELYTSNWAATAEALPSTFAYLHIHSETFHGDVVLATSFAHDTDTVGVVVGAVLGTGYGASSIPAHWMERTRCPIDTCLQSTNGLDIKEMAGELAELID